MSGSRKQFWERPDCNVVMLGSVGQAASPETIQLPGAQKQTQVTCTRRSMAVPKSFTDTEIPMIFTRHKTILLKKKFPPTI